MFVISSSWYVGFENKDKTFPSVLVIFFLSLKFYFITVFYG